MNIIQSRECARVLHFAGVLDRAGTETLLMNIYRHIDRKRVQFDFLVWDRPTYDYEMEVLEMGGRVFRTPNPGGSFMGCVRGIRRAMRSHHFAAVHAHVYFWNGIFLAAARTEGVPVRVCHSHNSTEGRPSPPSVARRVFNRAMRSLILFNATHLMSPSEIAGKGLFGNQCLSDARFKVVPNAIDINQFKDIVGGSGVRRELGLDSLDILIGHVGRFELQKNHPLLIEAFERIRECGIDAHLVLVGRGSEFERIANMVKVRGLERVVHFLGVRTDVPAILSALNVLIFPSLFEGLGIAVIESQAAGVPVVASDAVPLDADLKLGLLERLPLTSTIDVWSRAVLTALKAPIPEWNERRGALELQGYDVGQLAEYLQGVYLHTTLSDR